MGNAAPILLVLGTMIGIGHLITAVLRWMGHKHANDWPLVLIIITLGFPMYLRARGPRKARESADARKAERLRREVDCRQQALDARQHAKLARNLNDHDGAKFWDDTAATLDALAESWRTDGEPQPPGPVDYAKVPRDEVAS